MKTLKSLLSSWAIVLLVTLSYGWTAELDTLNSVFLESYESAETELRDQLGPVVIVGRGQLTLIQGKQRQSWDLDMRLYHDMKAIAHIPVSLFLICYHHSDSQEQLPKQTIAKLKKLKGFLLSSRTSLNKSQLPHSPHLLPHFLDNELKAFDRSLQFIDRVLVDQRVSSAHLKSYVELLKPMISFNMKMAVQHELKTLTHKMNEISKSLGSSALSKLHVIILGPPQPKEGNLKVQFFENYLKVKNDRSRVLYAENLDDPDKALKLLKDVLLDREISSEFFSGKRLRLEKDLLADEAAQYLKTHP